MSRLIGFAQYLQSCLPDLIQRSSICKDELCLYTQPKHLHPLMLFLRNHRQCQFQMWVDLTAVDYPKEALRFHLHYLLQSILHNARIRVRLETDELTPVPSVSDLFEGACWSEREVYDMFGVSFEGHPDLRRILTDYGFEGHPLRKDFPLTGHTEVRWDEEEKRVVSEPLQMTQEYRRFELDDNPVRRPDFLVETDQIKE